MARYKPIDTSSKFIPVDFAQQVVPGTFEYALCHLIDNELDLSRFDAQYSNDQVGAPAYAPGLLLKITLLGYCCGTHTGAPPRRRPGAAPIGADAA